MTGLLSTVVLATAREDAGRFVETLVQVYFALIIAYILFSLVRTAGISIPYNRAIDVVEQFLRNAVEPYLAIFRRFIPPIAMFDLSPIVGIIVLQVVGNLVANLVAG